MALSVISILLVAVFVINKFVFDNALTHSVGAFQAVELQ